MPKIAPYFSKKLIVWYLQNKRDLPWRNTNNPYHIWLSEIMLQQTRVLQGLPYYLKFIEAYPKVENLANAPEDEVLKLWQGLGYYSRARNLHATAKMVANEMNGTFPNNYKDLLKLKGVGVYRVLSRFFGISTPINSTAGQKEFKQLAQELIDKEQPGTFNQAIMEFGARYCVPQSSDCENCIFNDSCVAFQQKKVAQLPVKIKSKSVKQRFFNYLVILSENERTVLQQRNGKGIWHKLYEFPLIETSKEIEVSELQELPQFQDFSEKMNIRNISLYNQEAVVHKLSHQHLNTRFWIIETLDETESSVAISEIESYAVPVLIANFVSEFFENY